MWEALKIQTLVLARYLKGDYVTFYMLYARCSLNACLFLFSLCRIKCVSYLSFLDNGADITYSCAATVLIPRCNSQRL